MLGCLFFLFQTSFISRHLKWLIYRLKRHFKFTVINNRITFITKKNPRRVRYIIYPTQLGHLDTSFHRALLTGHSKKNIILITPINHIHFLSDITWGFCVRRVAVDVMTSNKHLPFWIAEHQFRTSFAAKTVYIVCALPLHGQLFAVGGSAGKKRFYRGLRIGRSAGKWR